MYAVVCILGGWFVGVFPDALRSGFLFRAFPFIPQHIHTHTPIVTQCGIYVWLSKGNTYFYKESNGVWHRHSVLEFLWIDEYGCIIYGHKGIAVHAFAASARQHIYLYVVSNAVTQCSSIQCSDAMWWVS